MASIPESEKTRIIAALEKAQAKAPCPRCGNLTFTLLEGYFNQPIQFELSGYSLGGPSVPSVVVACNRCGFLSQHALGPLGLLPAEASAAPQEVAK
jgi:ribosomal protein S27AE